MVSYPLRYLCLSVLWVLPDTDDGDATGAAASGQPANVDTTTMTQFGGIVWWLVRIVILAIGGIPGVINLVKGLSDQDDRQRNIGLIVLVVTGAAVAATFALSSIIGF